MKKILALILAVVMAFSIATVPASAADCCDVDVEEIETTINDVFDFAKNLAVAIHELVGGILAVFGEECPFCDEIHNFDDADDDADCDCDCDDEPLYETADVVIGEAFRDKDVTFYLNYPMNVDAGFVFQVPTKSIVIDSVATAHVKTAIILEEGAVTGKIVFKDTTTTNYFHPAEGFKLLINNSGTPVAIVIASDIYVGDVLITAANIGNYIEGPYTVSVTA